MAINWVLECQPVAARGFVCETQEEADEKCANKADYDACLRVTLVHKSVVTITLAHVDRSVKLLRGDLLRLGRALKPHGITDIYFERALGRLGPFAKLVTLGPLAGMYHVDIVAVLAAADGDY